MNLDPTKFGKEEELTTGVHRASRPVKTPQPGPSTEPNHITYLRNGDEYFKIQKVSDQGWSVSRYTDTPDEELISLKSIGDGLNAHEAKRLAHRRAAERTQ